MGHRNAPIHDKGARVMNYNGHNMSNHNVGNHNNAHKAPNREIAQKTTVSNDRPRNNHGGSGHFGGHR